MVISQVRCGALTGLSALLDEHGASLAVVLKQHGFAEDALDFAEARMPVADLVTILNAVSEVPGFTLAGLRLAEVQGLEVLGVLGQLLQRSANLADAFAMVRRFMALHNCGEQWRLQPMGNRVAIQRFEHAYTGLDARQYHELALANCLRLAQVLAGRELRPERVEFAHRPLDDEKHYRRFFGCEVRFDQEYDQLILDAQYMALPVAIGEGTGEISAAFIQQLAQRYKDDLRTQMVTLIMQTLGAQQHSLPEIANLMNINPRTLQRRLEGEGIVYRELVSDVRSQMACWHLASSDMDITLLSAVLGYTDVSGFSRAFRQWHGCSPRQWRQQAR